MIPFHERSLDHLARQVVVASMLYYGLDAPSMLTDGEYDEATDILSRRFKELEPIRQWQLGSAKAIQSTGIKVKVTAMAACAAVTYLEKHHGETRQVIRTRSWREPTGRDKNPERCAYLYPSEFSWA